MVSYSSYLAKIPSFDGFRKMGLFLRPKQQAVSQKTMDRLKETKETTVVATTGAPTETLERVASKKRFDFDALEKKQVEEVDLSKPERQKAPAKLREGQAKREDRAAEREGGRTTSRLLDMKKKMDEKK